MIYFKNLSDSVSLSGYWNYSLSISKTLTQKSGQEKTVHWQMAAWLLLWLLLVCVRRSAVSLSVSNFALIERAVARRWRKYCWSFQGWNEAMQITYFFYTMTDVSSYHFFGEMSLEPDLCFQENHLHIRNASDLIIKVRGS